MSSDYSRPLQRVRQVGTGFLAGKVSEDPNVRGGVRENLRFRVDSLRAMLTGDDTMEGAQPLDRRMKIMQNRRELVMGGNSSSSSTSSSTPTGSGAIGNSSGSMNERTPSSDIQETSLMSEVKRGTRERALNRGFEG
jgi:hypothetical protein